MRKEVSPKLQGDGRESWVIKEYDENDSLITSYMVYEDPNIKPIPSVDVIGIIQSLSTEELTQLKQILNN